MSIEHLIAMGGYGCYVWPAYSITFLVFSINIFSSMYERRLIKKIISRRYE